MAPPQAPSGKATEPEADSRLKQMKGRHSGYGDVWRFDMGLSQNEVVPLYEEK